MLGRRVRIWLLVAVVVLWGGWRASAQPSRLAQVQYVRSCGGCHVALPAEVMPTETWKRLITDPNHYGQQIEIPRGALAQLVFSYLKENSRTLMARESIPFRLSESRYFRALHPQVQFPQPVRVTSCIDCHPGANLGDFITLTPQWGAD